MIAFPILYLTICFDFKRSLTILVSVRFRVPFPNPQAFSEIFCTLHIDYNLYEKTILGIFVYLFIYEVTATKANFPF